METKVTPPVRIVNRAAALAVQLPSCLDMSAACRYHCPQMVLRPACLPLAIAAALALATTTCATTPGLRGERDVPTERPALSGAADAIRAELGAGARSLLGAAELVVKGRRFNWDCTGLVLAIYWHAGIDLARDFGRYAGGGVSRLYRTLQDDSLLYTTREPILGDLVFWDDTYDADGDGTWDDPLTHVGMVMETAADGIISYVHLNYRKGIVIEQMSLREPDVHQRVKNGRVTIVNSPLRMAEAGKPHPDRWLAGQLYRVLGMGYLYSPR
jgi:hypothetical protein